MEGLGLKFGGWSILTIGERLIVPASSESDIVDDEFEERCEIWVRWSISGGGDRILGFRGAVIIEVETDSVEDEEDRIEGYELDDEDEWLMVVYMSTQEIASAELVAY